MAQRLQWDFIDTDRMITDLIGKPVAEILRSQGEQVFRSYECSVVAKASLADRTVIATGGGVPLNPDNMAALSQNGRLVWLKVSPEIALKRAGNLTSRPLIDPSCPLESMTARLKEREPLYRKAPYSVDTDIGSVDATVEKIISFFPEIKNESYSS